jgi:hypothetical protein
MDHTPASVSLAAARALQPPEGSRAAEVLRDDHVWIRFAAAHTAGEPPCCPGDPVFDSQLPAQTGPFCDFVRIELRTLPTHLT